MITPVSFIKAQQIDMYLDLHDKERTPIAMAADGTGVMSETNNILYWDLGGNPVSIFTPSSGATRPYAVCSRDYMYFEDGVSADLKKWTLDTGLSNWGIVAPTTAVTLGSPGAGNITLNSGRIYYTAFFDAAGNYSDLSPASVTTGPLTNNDQPLTNIPVSSDPQVTMVAILATADGGDPTILYHIADVSNGTTTYTDNTPEATLLTNNIYQETDTSGVAHGLLFNTPPPNGSFPIANQGRIYMALGSQIVFSKSLAETTTSTGNITGRYEEDWPAANALEVAPGPEVISGLLTDGISLYIGTELHIYQLQGNGPTNFVLPQIVFNDTGLACQDVWQVVYLEGTPVGTMWMTPDFRVLGSDFTTFQNVGTTIQSTLNNINAAAAKNSWAISVRSGPYNLYCLFIPTGINTIPDTVCVYDMHVRKWFIWKCADLFSAGVYYCNLAGIPRFLVCDNAGITRVFEADLWLDRQGETFEEGIVSTIQTTWLDLGDATVRKTVNEMEVVTEDANMLVTVDGASTFNTFNTPNNLVTLAPLTLSQFNEYKVYLAGMLAKDKFYRFTLSSTSVPSSAITDTILGGLSIEVWPLDRI